MPVARSTASGNFAGWAQASATIGAIAVHRERLGARGTDRDRGVRVDQHPRPGIGLGDGSASLQCHRPCGRKTSRAPRAIPHPPAAGCRCGESSAIASATAAAVAAFQFEQQALEIARDLDVHARAQARLDGGDRHLAVGDIAGQDIVAVGADHQTLDRQPHAARDVAGIDIAEIAGRHAERDPSGPARRAPRRRRSNTRSAPRSAPS